MEFSERSTRTLMKKFVAFLFAALLAASPFGPASALEGTDVPSGGTAGKIQGKKPAEKPKNASKEKKKKKKASRKSTGKDVGLGRLSTPPPGTGYGSLEPEIRPRSPRP